MATGAKPVIYQERKRLTFVASLAFVAGLLFYVRADAYIGGVHISLITGIVYALIIGACALIVCVVLPSMRFMIEAIAISRLILSVIAVVSPSAGILILANPFAAAVVTVTGGIAVSRLIHGRIHRETRDSSRKHWFTGRLSQRRPVQIDGHPWQQRFVHWVEDMEPNARFAQPVRVT